MNKKVYHDYPFTNDYVTYMIDSQIDEEDSFLTELENEISILNREDGEWRRQIRD